MQLHRARAQFEQAGANLVLIGQATPRHAAHFRRRQGIQLPVLADEERVSYRGGRREVGRRVRPVAPQGGGQGRPDRCAREDRPDPHDRRRQPARRRARDRAPAARSSGRTCPRTPATTPRPRTSWRRSARSSRSVRRVCPIPLPRRSPARCSRRHDRRRSVTAGQALVVLEAMKMEHEVVGRGRRRRPQPSRSRSATPSSEGSGWRCLRRDDASPGADKARDTAPAASRDDLEAVMARHAPDARRRPSGRRRQAPRAGPAHRARERRRPRRPGQLRRVRPADVRRAGAPAPTRGADRPHARGRAGRRNRDDRRRAARSSCPTTTRCSPARRGCATTRRRTGCSSSPSAVALPVVLFAEGGGGRPGDVDWPIVAGLDCRAFHLFARLSGLVPLVGIASGYCFAGNAALLGCCDVVIATEDSSIGMGGPAMIEGGGLGAYDPEDVGPIDVQDANGVVDLRVADETAAVAAAKQLPVVLQWDRDRAGSADRPERAQRPHPGQPQARLRRSHGHRRAARRRARASRAASAPASSPRSPAATTAGRSA